MSDDFDFLDDYGAEAVQGNQLPDNEANSAINCAFVGFGAGGGKIAKSFLDLGFNKTLLFNTTEKDFPSGLNDDNKVVLPGADGVAKI